MTNILLLIAVVFIFHILTRGFKINPSINRIDLDQKQRFNGDMKNHEAGILVALMAKVAKSDGRVSELEAELIKNTLDNISNTFENSSEVREQLKKIYNKEKDNFSNVLKITKTYHKLTRFGYQKRLWLMEYLLNLAFIDADFSRHERMITEDIANALEIKPSDFNAFVARFESYYSQKQAQKQMNLQEAYRLLNSKETDDLSMIKKNYRALVKQNHPDILMGQGKSQNIIEEANKKLQKINEAYELVKKARE